MFRTSKVQFSNKFSNYFQRYVVIMKKLINLKFATQIPEKIHVDCACIWIISVMFQPVNYGLNTILYKVLEVSLWFHIFWNKFIKRVKNMMKIFTCAKHFMKYL